MKKIEFFQASPKHARMIIDNCRVTTCDRMHDICECVYKNDKI